MDIRDYLKTIRKRLGIKQQEFAEMLGVTNVTLSLWEHKKKEMHLRNKRKLFNLLKELGVNINEHKSN